MDTKKVAVLGDGDSIIGFKTLGIDTFSVSDVEAPLKIHELAKEDYGIIFLTEDIAPSCEEAAARYKTVAFPAIIIIPGNSGSSGTGLAKVKKNVERAIGFDMLFG